MQRTIEQSIQFDLSAAELYALYINPRRHAEFTGGGKVTISPKPGSKFSAFNGMLSGQMFLAVPGKLIVQRWRGTHWKKADPDSILVIYFVQDDKAAAESICTTSMYRHTIMPT